MQAVFQQSTIFAAYYVFLPRGHCHCQRSVCYSHSASMSNSWLICVETCLVTHRLVAPSFMQYRELMASEDGML